MVRKNNGHTKKIRKISDMHRLNDLFAIETNTPTQVVEKAGKAVAMVVYCGVLLTGGRN